MKHTNHFYLGRHVDDAGAVTQEPLTYPLNHLTTHALLLGATGSGKTGLGLVLVEEALRQGIPALLLDVKGDLTNLLLTFPDLSPEAFTPWIDAGAAARRGETPAQAAAAAAKRWREGLAAWDLTPETIAALRQRVDLRLSTPGLRAGRPVDILARFSAPPSDDPDEAALRAQGLASALLGLAGIDADPLHSREHILLTTLIRRVWAEQGALDIPTLIQQVQQPPIDRIGVFDLESFFPQKERFELALTLNNLIAAPGFARWREGEPLAIDRFLATETGQPRATVFYLAHLPETQRRFFVTLFLEELRTWVRSQTGTNALRAILFFDEVYGYLPPHPHNPPTKTPLMALVKQGRAAGLGVVLSTQNPADLDYKGLGNIGTWFVGTLRTDRDKARVMEGMEGTIAASGLRTRDVEAALTRLKPRVFLMHDANDGALRFFHSRWAMSYLRGPLTSAEVRTMLDEPESGGTTVQAGTAPGSAVTMAALGPAAAAASYSAASNTASVAVPTNAPQTAPAPAFKDETSPHPPSVNPGIPQVFLPATITAAWAMRQHEALNEALASDGEPDGSASRLVYRPHLLGAGTARIYDDRANVSLTDEQVWRVAPSNESWALRWDQGEMINLNLDDLARTPPQGAVYDPLPRAMARKSDYPKWESALKTQIYHQSEITLWACTPLRLYSRPQETKGAFLVRCQQAIEAGKQKEIEEERLAFERKMERLETKIRKEELELDKDEDRLQERRREELLSGAESVLSIFSKRRRSTRALSQTARQRRYVKDARADVDESVEMLELYNEQADELEATWQATAQQISGAWDRKLDDVRAVTVRAKRQDIDVRYCGLAWFPFWEVVAGGQRHLLPAYLPQ